MMRRLWLPLLLLLAACAQQAPLPSTAPTLAWPLQLHVQREQAGQTQDWLLVVQQETLALRWSLLDPLGIPLARQLLTGSQWQNDGLLPPNPQARELFAALLFALTPETELAQRYATDDWQVQGQQRTLREAGSPRWQIRYQQPLNFQLKTANGLSYRVETL
ncbi:hypothetical protein D3879_07755 [Pseudomonas cavernicola]|uniref:DUF3261 domain-containing protein n=1 Tax=Pseudomonas cavernicola TaxID=2320866 RepID=A0A418XPG6_9PSED|nr:DUF3261 domain-containing protein [Pseudomonas cavernicola]RJG14369.1 hypothetical protein D3879_07755 [Pseudomonas cavernicola]